MRDYKADQDRFFDEMEWTRAELKAKEATIMDTAVKALVKGRYSEDEARAIVRPYRRWTDDAVKPDSPASVLPFSSQSFGVPNSWSPDLR